MSAESGIVEYLSSQVGAPLPAFKLLLSILAGYPISFAYKLFLEQNVPSLLFKHLYFTSAGLLLYIFNYGWDVYHSFIAIFITYLMCVILLKKTKILVITNFIFHMGYLLAAYYYTESNEYDILWTMPHCVLVLRLIGFGFDVADGQQSEDKLSNEQRENSLKCIPSILEVLSYAYFPSAFLVGPQFPFKRYQRFINGEFSTHKNCISTGILRGSLGLMYLGIRQIGATYLPDDYFLSDEYKTQGFFRQIIEMGLWGKLSLYKYISCWLITEGALIVLGFSYTNTKDGKPDWSACSNVKIYLLESGTRMLHYVQSFNVNTNTWVASYVYKRLKFLNNRTLSYAGALIFLAVWHGFHTGYYMAFLLEYTIITFERQIESAYNTVVKNTKIGDLIQNNILCKIVIVSTMKFYNIVMMGWCLIPFIYLSYDKWIAIYQASSYWGFNLLGLWMIIHLIYQFCFNPNHKNPLKKKEE